MRSRGTFFQAQRHRVPHGFHYAVSPVFFGVQSFRLHMFLIIQQIQYLYEASGGLRWQE